MSFINFNSPIETDPWKARVELAAAHRIAVNLGFHEGIDNHFTLMVPGYDDRFFLAPFGIHWSEIKASDFLIVDFNGNILEGDKNSLIEDSAFFIHAPIHGSDRKVQCILHTHMPYATALALLENPGLEMISQNAIAFKDQVFDYEYNGLAFDREEGVRMGQALGEKAVLILRNHGIVTIGNNVADAFQNLYFYERTAEVHVLAYSTGRELRYIEKDIVDYTAEQFVGGTEINGISRAQLHFDALMRGLDRTQPDYAS